MSRNSQPPTGLQSLAIVKAKATAPENRTRLRLLACAGDETRLPVNWSGDIVVARRQGWLLALQSGFSMTDATLIATVVSELARCVLCERHGEIALRALAAGNRCGVEVSACACACVEPPGPLLSAIGRAMGACEVSFRPGYQTAIRLEKWRL